jgi:hypothetical protein
VIVRFVDIAGMDDHHCLNFQVLFNIFLLHVIFYLVFLKYIIFFSVYDGVVYDVFTTQQSPLILNELTGHQKRPRYMALEIHVLAWDRHTSVAGLNLLMESHYWITYLWCYHQLQTFTHSGASWSYGCLDIQLPM